MIGMVDFLLARITEDETEVGWVHHNDCATRSAAAIGGFPCDCVWPKRMAAECEAKRRIMERHSPCDDWSYGDPATCPELCALAAVYADHPDYNEQEWRP